MKPDAVWARVAEKTSVSITKLPTANLAQKRGTHYLFVDNLRFWSMLAIVTMHGTSMDSLASLPRVVSQLIGTPLKFGTIAFFFASGFLLGGRIETSKPIEYLGRRFRRVFLPWTVWILLFTVVWFMVEVAHHTIPAAFSVDLVWEFGRIFLSGLTATAFWFVPNLFVGTCVLLLFRRHLFSLWLGLALLAVNLFYVVNIYACWVPVLHSEAVFGFVFYLWLGSYASRHYNSLQDWLQRTRMTTLFGLAVFTAALAFVENRLLERLGSVDPMNTLRLTNQAFSVAVILMMVKLRKATWPRFVDVQRHTFGIYLSHTILLGGILAFTRRNLPAGAVGRFQNNVTAELVLRVVITAFAYLLSLAVTAVLTKTPHLGWIVGYGQTARKAKESLTNKLSATTSDPVCEA